MVGFANEEYSYSWVIKLPIQNTCTDYSVKFTVSASSIKLHLSICTIRNLAIL